MAKLSGMAIAWMNKDDWPRWLEVDHEFQPDYAHWRKRMEATIERLEAEGIHAVKVIIRPDEFVEWCRFNGCAVDSKGRSLYAALALAESQGAATDDRREVQLQ